jgi:hypothetical protein
MKKIFTTLAALGLAAVINTGHTTEAKADGGAVLLGVGAYLLVDALVGRHCYHDDWPFNVVREVGSELHGRSDCYPHHHTYHQRYHRHHRHHHQD